MNVATVIVGVLTMVAVAHFFGASRNVEIYFAATGLQAFVLSLSQTGQISEVLLPQFHKVKHEYDKEKAYLFFSCCLNGVLIIIAIASVLLWVLADPIVQLRVPGFESTDIALGVQFFRALLPLILIQVATALLTTLAHAEGWFGLPESATVAGGLVSLTALVTLAGLVGPWALVLALWLGQGARFLLLLVILYRKGFTHSFRLKTQTGRPARIYLNVAKTLPYVLTTQVYAFVIDAALSTLPQGTFAIFKYVGQIWARAQSLFLRPVSIVFFTQFSDALSRGASGLRELIRLALARTLLICVPLLVAVAVCREPLIIALLGEKGFTTEQIALAAQLLIIFFTLTLASGLQQTGRKTTMSLGMVGRQYSANTAIQVLSALVAWPLIGHFGILGAVATVAINTVALSCTPLVLLAFYRRDLAILYPVDRIWRWTLTAAISLAIANGVWFLLQVDAEPLGRIGALTATLVFAGLSISITIFTAWLLGVEEVRHAVSAAIRLWRNFGKDAKIR